MKGIWKGISYFILYFVLTILIQISLSIIFMSIATLNNIESKDMITTFVNSNILGITIISGILTTLVLYLIFKFNKKQIKKEWKLNEFKPINAIFASMMSFSFSFLFTLFTYDIPIENSLMISKSAIFYNEIIPLLGTIMMVTNLLLIAPVTEEIALRGIVYTKIEEDTNKVIAVIVSSILFGIMHLMAGGIVLVIGSTLMALILGYILYKFNSLWICIIAHSIANLPDLILYIKPNISDNILFIIEISFLVIFITSTYFVHNSTTSNNN